MLFVSKIVDVRKGRDVCVTIPRTRSIQSHAEYHTFKSLLPWFLFALLLFVPSTFARTTKFSICLTTLLTLSPVRLIQTQADGIVAI